MPRQRDFIRISTPMTPRARLMRVVEQVANEHGVEPVDIMSRCHRRDLSRARQDAFSRLRKQGLTFTQIGRLFDRDHTTVMHGVRTWEKGQ